MSKVDEYARSGIAAINEQRFDDAIESFQHALELEPDRPDMNNALGMAFLHKGAPGEAVPYLERAVELAESYPDDEHADMKVHFLTALATAYQLFDQVPEATALLERTVERFPDPVDARLQLGQLLLTSCQLADGLAVYEALATHPGLDEHGHEAAQTVHDAARAFLESTDEPDIFLRAHRDSYTSYFDDIAASQETWYAEAARMAPPVEDDGEPRPYIPEGARPYAMIRVDLVNPENGEVAGVYSDTEPMIVAVEGLEPLAQIPIMFPWKSNELDVWVCSQVPWHWLTITVQFEEAMSPEARIDAIDPIIGEWYLAGYNGDFGEREEGRFHYVTDPEMVGDRAITYTVDLGRTRYEAIESLLDRLARLGEQKPIRRILLGNGYLPD